MTWIPLTSNAELDNLLAESDSQPVAIFKHSTTCSISATAKGRLERQWDAAVGDAVKLYYLDLHRYRPVSNEITQRLGVEHESPQLLVINHGQCVYDASHMAIQAGAVKQHIG